MDFFAPNGRHRCREPGVPPSSALLLSPVLFSFSARMRSSCSDPITITNAPHHTGYVCCIRYQGGGEGGGREGVIPTTRERVSTQPKKRTEPHPGSLICLHKASGVWCSLSLSFGSRDTKC